MPVSLRRAALAAAAMPFTVPALADTTTRPPITLVSSSSSFDGACRSYYRQSNDADVLPAIADPFCTCIAGGIEGQGLGPEVLDFLGRTYSEDLTAFMDEYPNGQAWMDAYFAAEQQCKRSDYGANEPPADQEPNPPPGAVEAGSWGDIVRDGPGQNHRKLATLREGERVKLIQNTSVMFDGFPWWMIEYRGGRQGFQWGGILCALDEPMEGVYEACGQ